MNIYWIRSRNHEIVSWLPLVTLFPSLFYGSIGLMANWESYSGTVRHLHNNRITFPFLGVVLIQIFKYDIRVLDSYLGLSNQV